MAALAGLTLLVGHGGTAGAVAEATVAVGAAALFLAIWLRERRRSAGASGPAELRDEDETP